MAQNDAADTHGLIAGFGITNSGMTGVLVRATRNSTEVARAVTVTFPVGTIENGVIVDTARVGAAIRTAARELGVRDRSIAMAALTTEYSMRSVRLPDVPASERRTLVRGELEQLEALPDGGGAFDLLWLPAPIEDGRQRADATACYTTDAHIERLKSSVKQSGFRLELLEPASLALVRGLVGNGPTPHSTAILCLAETHSDLCIHDGTAVRHLRRIPAGTNDLIAVPPPGPAGKRIGADLDDPGADAPRALWSPGEQPDSVPGDQLSESAEAPPAAEAAKVGAGATSSFFVSEVQRTLAFFAREFPEAAQPETLQIVGAAPPSRALQALLSRALSIPVSTDLPSLADEARLNPNSSDDVQSYLSAVGVAVGRMGIERGVPRLNVSLQEAAAHIRRSAPNLLRTGVIAGGGVLAAAVLVVLAITSLNYSANRDLTAVEAQIAALNKERAPLIFNDEVAAAAQAARLKAQIPASSILGRVAAAEQPGVALTAMHVTQDGKVALEGDATDTPSMQRFAYTAGQGTAIIAPTFEMMHQDEKGALTFRLVGKAPGGQAAATSQFK